MRKEELDRLKEKYWAGQTSVEEERRLKELEDSEIFGMLRQAEEKMEWSFEEFMDQVEEKEEKVEKKVIPFSRRIITLTSIAASLLLGFFVIRQMLENKNEQVKPIIAKTEVKNQALDVAPPKEGLQAEIVSQEPRIQDLKERPVNRVQMTSVKKSAKKAEELVQVSNALDDEMYVEINGVRIYDEEKALEVTETALHFATSNLRKGMEGVENIKYLKIEI